MVGREIIGRAVVRCWWWDVHLVLLDAWEACPGSVCGVDWPAHVHGCYWDVKKKKKKKKKNDNIINVSTHRLQIRSGTVEEDRYYTVSNLSELLTIDICAHLFTRSCITALLFLERSLMFIYYHNIHAWILNAFRLQYPKKFQNNFDCLELQVHYK